MAAPASEEGPMEGTDGTTCSESDQLWFHGVGSQRHVVRLLQMLGVEKVLKDEHTPYTDDLADGESATNAICFKHVKDGCTCGAFWRCIPRTSCTMLGGKVSMEKMLRQFGMTGIYPRTFLSLAEWEANREAEEADGPAKWFVKVSHLHSRKGMLCSSDPDAIRDHVNALEKRHKYVIQKEVANPLILDGYKMLLRLWVLLTIHPDGGVMIHFSRRLRVNRLMEKYSTSEASSDADLCHHPANVFADSRKWGLYPQYWSSCVTTADALIRSLLRKWQPTFGSLVPAEGGRYNVFAIDYIPTTAHEAVLIEANVDPGFRNKCTETKFVAQDLVNFFFFPMLNTGCITVPDPNFHSVRVEPRELFAKTIRPLRVTPVACQASQPASPAGMSTGGDEGDEDEDEDDDD
eukprot:TRINITY_DN4154_c3_g1_i1.p1 TRINITY_DN4154_c3_g1~~TRINITY_DN4154_c3_g1_i1.p1  ORF type:complete len:405 (+),score=131.52 TRINITY_DN4154_c3_g1_i1:64-1278(+)